MLRQIFSILFVVSIANAVTLSCNFQKRDFLSAPNLYTCQAVIDSTGSTVDGVVEGIIGSHLNGLNNNDVRGISFYNHNMRRMLTNITGSFPNIEAIQIVNMRLEELTNEHLKSFRNLRHLEITNNNIQTVNMNLFQNATNLQAVLLNNNTLRHVDYRAFEHLNGLRFLQLNNNECITDVTVNNDHSAISQHFFSIFRNCPITTEMIKEEIMNSDEFKDIWRSIAELKARDCDNNGGDPGSEKL